MSAIATFTSATNSSNRGSLRLLNKNVPVDITTIDKVVVKLDDGTVIDSDDHTGFFDWWGGPTGVLRCYFGSLNLGFSTKTYNAKLFIYDPLNYLGIYWGDFRIRKVAATTEIY